MRELAARRRSLVWGALLGCATIAVAVLSYLSPGASVTNVSLNNGGIWVTKDSQSLTPFALFDKPVDQLAGGIAPPSGAPYNIDVLQSGTDVLLCDQSSSGTLYAVSTADIAADPSGVPAPGCGNVGPVGSR